MASGWTPPRGGSPEHEEKKTYLSLTNVLVLGYKDQAYLSILQYLNIESNFALKFAIQSQDESWVE